jgi:predicted kinase
MNINEFKNIESPYVIILIGTPLSGKSTFCKQFIKEIDKNVVIINRDELVMETYGSRDYNKAFKNVNQKNVDKLLNKRMIDANDKKMNVIIDMTHLTHNRRKNNLKYFTNKYYKIAVIFPILDKDEYIKRDNKRIIDENKHISINIIEKMIKSYQKISDDEKFDKIISL